MNIYLKDIFGSAEHQEKGTFGLCNRLILTKNCDNAVLNRGDATNTGKIKLMPLDGMHLITIPLSINYV